MHKSLPKVKQFATGFANTFKVVAYDLPKTILRRTFTNANVTDYFPDLKKKK